MATPSRIAEFHGPENLPQAAFDVLNSPQLDMAIVHDVEAVIGQDWQLGSAALEEAPISIHNISLLETLVPEMTEVDEVVQKWLSESVFDLSLVGNGLQAAYLKNRTIGLHPDATKEGPLSFSIRTDENTGTTRQFCARRFSNLLTVRPDGQRNFDAEAQLQAKLAEIQRSSWNRRRSAVMSCVDQRPGDWVIFPNHPSPAIHASSSSQGRRSAEAAQALIASYYLDLKQPGELLKGPYAPALIKV